MNNTVEKRTNRQTGIGIAQSCGAFALGGSSIVAAGLLTAHIPVFITCFLSMGTGLIILLPLQMTRVPELRKLKFSDYRNIFFQGVTGMLLFRIFTLTGLKFTSAANAGIITGTSPAIMTLLSIIFLKEKPGFLRWISVLLAVAGILIINIPDFHRTEGDMSDRFLIILEGNGLILLAVICESCLALFRKTQKSIISPVTNSTVLVLICMLLCVIPAAFELKDFSLAGLGLKNWSVLFYYGLFPTALGYLLMASGVVKIPGSLTGITMTATPVTALLLSIPLLNESLLPEHIAGCLLVIIALITGSIRSE